MAEIVVVDGPAVIKVGTGTASALETLGYTEDGAQIQENIFSIDVPGDQNGGPEGPPIDIQYLGEFHIVRLNLTKWDVAIEAKCSPRLLGGTAGAVGTPGTLWHAESKFYRLLIHTTSRPRNYLAAIPRGVFELNKGTKFSRRIMEWWCYASAGTIYNSTTSG